MKQHLRNYGLCYFFVLTFLLLLADYNRVVCCDESDKVCVKCGDYIEHYFGD